MSISKNKKENLMKIVMQEVEKAIEEGNSPFGAILIDENGNIIEKAHNTAKSMCNPVLHAEINLITKACKKLNTRDLSKYYIMSNVCLVFIGYLYIVFCIYFVAEITICIFNLSILCADTFGEVYIL